MKKLLALILSLSLLASVGCSFAEELEGPIVVGSLTKMSGDFFAGLFSNNTADADVRTLLHDGATVSWQENGNYAVNAKVVTEAAATGEAGDANKTYTFTLREDMLYSDGTKLTAKDYVFTVLLLSSPQFKEIGALNTSYMQLVGWEDYANGANVFSGVRLLADNQFSLTIDAKYLPYFYELIYVQVTPYPMSVLAPGCGVADDGQGAYITGDLTAEMLRASILDETTGYLSHPSVVNGAYVLDRYDAAQGVAEFSMNPYYMGNYAGQKPTIAQITFKEMQYDTVVAQLLNGELDLANKLSSADVVNEAMLNVNAGLLGVNYYLRSGMSFIAFACEQGLTSEKTLRQAVAKAISGSEITDQYLGTYGQPVYGYSGYGQWMANAQVDRLTELNLYEKDVGAALDLLIRDGFVFTQDGQRYTAASTGARYRGLKADGASILTGDAAVEYSNGGAFTAAQTQQIAGFEPLILKMAVPENNPAATLVVEKLNEGFAEMGVTLEVTELKTDELLKHYYRQVEREYDMFFLATNFSHIFDPYYAYNTADAYQGLNNTSGLKDEKLMQLADELRRVDPGDTETYMAKWMEFQLYWVEVLPLVPLYSNAYFDFYRPDMYNYTASMYSSWADAILYATIGEPPVEEIVEGETPTEELVTF